MYILKFRLEDQKLTSVLKYTSQRKFLDYFSTPDASLNQYMPPLHFTVLRKFCGCMYGFQMNFSSEKFPLRCLKLGHSNEDFRVFFPQPNRYYFL